MKNLTLIILCFFGLNIIAQTTVVIEAKDNKDTQAINKLKKQEITVKVDGEPINAKITEIKTDPTQEDIRKLTPQLAKSVADLKKYHDHEVKIETLKNKNKQLESEIKSLKSGNSNALKSARAELENCKLQIQNSKKNQEKITQEKTFTKNMINKCLQSGSKEVPKEIRDFLIKSADNLNLSEDKRKLERYNSHVAKMKSATDLLAKPYNKTEIEKKITTLKGSSSFPKLNTESEKIIKKLSKYCKYNNDLREELNKQNAISVKQMRKDNIKRSMVYKIIIRDNYEYLKKQAQYYIDNKSHSLKKQSCPN
jgi:hypothetical protein